MQIFKRVMREKLYFTLTENIGRPANHAQLSFFLDSRLWGRAKGKNEERLVLFHLSACPLFHHICFFAYPNKLVAPEIKIAHTLNTLIQKRSLRVLVFLAILILTDGRACSPILSRGRQHLRILIVGNRLICCRIRDLIDTAVTLLQIKLRSLYCNQDKLKLTS